jgi:hypothetical protein
MSGSTARIDGKTVEEVSESEEDVERSKGGPFSATGFLGKRFAVLR